MKKILLEINAGAGGREAKIFNLELRDMYIRYLKNKANINIVGESSILLNECSSNIISHLEKEVGVHRVQRIPETESIGRIHTSTASVCLIDISEENDIVINKKDIKVETFRASGHGGQSVNKTESAVRITHLPTGISTSCQDEKSQGQNREKALKNLKYRLLKIQKEKKEREKADSKKEQINGNLRSQKIRTYNFKESRVTDHRTKQTFYNINNFMNAIYLDEIHLLL